MMTISTYDQVLKMTMRLDLPEQLQLLETISRMVRDQIVERERHTIMELEGLGADVWQEVDVQAYVNQERTSWES